MIFCCPLCKKWKNLNRRKSVIGFFDWKKVDVCDKCYADAGFGGVGE